MLLEDLRRAFGGVAAVDGVSFAVAEGSITALIGPNGAGKTTVFNLVSGFLRADAGRIRFAGRRIDGLRGDAVARAGLVRTFQTPRVLTRMRVLDNLLLAARDQPGERFAMRWLAPRRVAAREQAVRRQAIELLALLRLDHLADGLCRHAVRRPAQAARTRPRADDRAAHDPARRADGRHRAGVWPPSSWTTSARCAPSAASPCS